MVHSSVFTDGPRSGLISPIRGSSETLQLPLVPPPHPHTWGVSVGWGGPNLFDVKERAALICVHGSGWRCVIVHLVGGDQLSTGCWCVLCRWWNCGFGDLVREWWSGEGKKRNCKVDIHEILVNWWGTSCQTELVKRRYLRVVCVCVLCPVLCREHLPVCFLLSNMPIAYATHIYYTTLVQPSCERSSPWCARFSI